MLAVAGCLEIDSEVLLPIATPFCSGMSRTSGLCGAVTGGLMGIGLALGRRDPDASVQPSYEASQRLLSLFEAEFGSLVCTALTGFDFSAPGGLEAYAASDSLARCSELVRLATETACRLALEDG